MIFPLTCYLLSLNYLREYLDAESYTKHNKQIIEEKRRPVRASARLLVASVQEQAGGPLKN
jgi:hypothetical protein